MASRKHRNSSFYWWALSSLIVLSFSSCSSSVLADPTTARQLQGLRGAASDEEIIILHTASLSVPPASNVTVPLHAHSGTHHVHVYIGSPPQRQTLIVDTGSRLMAFPCRPCKKCGTHASPYFDPTLSTTYRTPTCGQCQLTGISTCSLYNDQCIISQKYTEGSSWNANELEDLVWLGSEDITQSIEQHMQLAVPFTFGCQTKIQGLFRKQYADGILGLANHETSMVNAYYRAKAIARNAYSLCFTPMGGLLSLGGTLPTQHHLEPMQVTPMTGEHGWYSVHIVSVQVGDIVIASEEDGDAQHSKALAALNGGKGCILDSGTTDTYFPSSLKKAFIEAMATASGGVPDANDKKRSQLYTLTQFQRLPDIAFLFANNAKIVMVPKHYMEGVPLLDDDDNTTPSNNKNNVKPWEGGKMLTNRIYLDEKEGAVLGANAMFGYDILFDAQGRQVGIAKANCGAKDAVSTIVL